MGKKKTTGELIKEALDGRTQRWLAVKAGIPEDRLSNKLKGYEVFKDGELVEIDNILGTSFFKQKEGNV
mgnify:FL=1